MVCVSQLIFSISHISVWCYFSTIPMNCFFTSQKTVPLQDAAMLLVTLNLVCCSEKRPARSDLIVLVAHNDDPTGELKLMS
jgi:hypothetical protein